MIGNKIQLSELSNKAKNSLYDYYYLTLSGKKHEHEIEFYDLGKINLNQFGKLRNVGKTTVNEVEKYCNEQNIQYSAIVKPIDKRCKNNKLRNEKIFHRA